MEFIFDTQQTGTSQLPYHQQFGECFSPMVLTTEDVIYSCIFVIMIGENGR
jgi:hypothetical protein